MSNETRDSVVLDELDLASLNEVLKRIALRLDALEGLQGTIELLDVVNSNAGVTVTDANGTIIHRLGADDV
jgi:hypothetical protein